MPFSIQLPAAGDHRQTERWRDRLLLRSGATVVAARDEEVMRIQAADRVVVVHLLDRQVPIRAPLRRFLDILDPHQFVRVHRAAVVNVAHVREIRTDTHGDFVVILTDGTKVPGSRTYREGIEAFLSGRTGARPIGGKRGLTAKEG